MRHAACTLAAAFALCTASAHAEVAKDPAGPTTAGVLEASTAADWRKPDPDNTLYLDLPAGRVVIELAPQIAPRHAANIRTLAKEHYWDGLAILRAQDDYVVQWGDPASGEKDARSFGTAEKKLPAEFTHASVGLGFAKLPQADAYAPEAGWVDGFPAARDPKTGQTWLAHCYAAVGAGRDMAADSSNGAELYVVIGHAPRHLDRNITLVGRVLQGMELLSVMPRGKQEMGFYGSAAERVPIKAITLASQVPEAERVPLEVFRTDTPAFQQLIEARRNRREAWFIDPVGKIELCNVPIPVRLAAATAK